MPDNRLVSIGALLERDGSTIADEWQEDVLKAWASRYPDLISADEIRQQMRKMLTEIARLFAGHDGDLPPAIAPDSALATLANELSVSRARLGFRPGDTAHYLIALRTVLTRHLLRMLEKSPLELVACLGAVDNVVNHIGVLTFEAFVDARERIITQQSLSLIELSSPVVRLWDRIIVLPLIGVIDTVRARQLTERMLEAIVRYDALVTLIDVTGVPVFDTGVAKHIMMAIEAAQLLGTRIVMTGLSPDGAQTLAKLNIRFTNIISRASLRAGVAEALKATGQRVVPIGP